MVKWFFLGFCGGGVFLQRSCTFFPMGPLCRIMRYSDLGPRIALYVKIFGGEHITCCFRV